MEREDVAKATALASEVIREQMEKNGHKIYEGSGGGQIFTIAVAVLAAGIMMADAKKAE